MAVKQQFTKCATRRHLQCALDSGQQMSSTRACQVFTPNALAVCTRLPPCIENVTVDTGAHNCHQAQTCPGAYQLSTCRAWHTSNKRQPAISAINGRLSVLQAQGDNKTDRSLLIPPASQWHSYSVPSQIRNDIVPTAQVKCAPARTAMCFCHRFILQLSRPNAGQ
eukprot:GHRR01036531.1.p1 GENE.GHRR01036531.1~~GHRR01036531.1.p1  ORF type:complete len:166 (-),score=29.39 GHRR01036531.1:2073-2570(-)